MKSSVVAFPMEYIPLSAPFFFHVDFYFLSILLSHGKNGKVEIFMRKTVADLEYTKGDTNSGEGRYNIFSIIFAENCTKMKKNWSEKVPNP